MPDSKVEKWRSWVEAKLRDEVLRMNHDRAIFKRVGEIARDGDLPNSAFWGYFIHTYAQTQSVAVRRQAEPSARVLTVGRLVREISENPEKLSREIYLEAWPSDDLRWGGLQFEKIANAEGTHLDPAIPAADLADLGRAAGRVRSFVDESVAHADARAAAELYTFDDLDGAIDKIGELFSKYYMMLTAGEYATLIPVIQHDWEAVFRRQWLPERPQRPRPVIRN